VDLTPAKGQLRVTRHWAGHTPDELDKPAPFGLIYSKQSRHSGENKNKLTIPNLKSGIADTSLGRVQCFSCCWFFFALIAVVVGSSSVLLFFLFFIAFVVVVVVLKGDGMSFM